MLPDEVITSKIYLIRGEKVMLDRDLAKLFEVKTIRLREQVKRNMEKFPIHFIFQLTNEEVEVSGIAFCDTFQLAEGWNPTPATVRLHRVVL